MNKVYVDVVAEFRKDGKLVPIFFTWEDGRKYNIDRILKIERCASRKAGGVGMRDRKAICFMKWINGLWREKQHKERLV